MKIIEAMKKVKDLQKKAEDYRSKIYQYHADVDFEQPTYGTVQQQRDQITAWLQGHSDIVKEISELKTRIQKTNVLTLVTIELGDKQVTKTITEWILRRRELAGLELEAWDKLNDKGMSEKGQVRKSTGETLEVKIRRFYDPKERDTKRELYRSEPSKIDGTLEVVNAVTDLVEL